MYIYAYKTQRNEKDNYKTQRNEKDKHKLKGMKKISINESCIIFSSSVYLLAESQIRICISELFPDVTTFVLLYLGRKFIQGNSNLALDVINNISKHFRAILPH